ncbi:hypothetical protein ACFVWX_32970 [Streptomyces sp. NPDC058220]|uniref:hypothetical protein n=1 Tax=Streptomyces sp. NPDC058220 TaxID=3346387 RepID=UPI0036EA008F
MNASTLSEPTPEDGEATSFAETTKNLFKKHKPKILAVGAVGLAVIGVVASLAEGQDAKDTKGSEPVPDPVAGRQLRRPPVLHEVAEHLVKLAVGRQASEAAKAAYKDATGEHLPADHTWRRRSSRGGSSEARTPVQASA